LIIVEAYVEILTMETMKVEQETLIITSLRASVLEKAVVYVEVFSEAQI